MKNRLLSAFLLLFAAVGMGAVNAPKYVFYFIGDGMGWGQVNTTQEFLRDVAKSDTLLTMLRFPVVSSALTYSASNPITDSAAAGTALATGVKTKNDMVGMTPDTVAVASIAEQMKAMGYGIGLVTTVSPDDATPAAFYAKVPKRSMSYEIGKQAAASGFNFIAGAYFRGLVDKKGNATDLQSIFAKHGVDVAMGLDQLSKAKSDKVVLLAPVRRNNNDVGYTVDSTAGVMTLRQMTKACIDHLTKVSPDKFFMMVEGGSIDHACHANDAGAAIHEVLSFDATLAMALDFYKAHPQETLIVVTADHETGGMAVGITAHKYTADLDLLPYQRISKEMLTAHIKTMLKSRRAYHWDDIEALLKEKLGFWTVVPVSEDETEALREAFEKTFVKREAGVQTLYTLN